VSDDLRRFPEWSAIYATGSVEQMPWYYAELDPDLEHALEAQSVRSGRVLDLGTGPGTQAIALAERGFEVTGSDIAEAAIAGATARAEAKGVRVEFVVDDILDSRLRGGFDLVLDRGCFHVMPPERRSDYVARVHTLLSRGSRLLILKCFSSEQPGAYGPHRFTPDQLRAIFRPGFEVLSIEPTVYHGTLDPPPKALLAVMRAA
jgi:cyclopropane fatty-acyl-phospholipid synthase-like methyltransferase